MAHLPNEPKKIGDTSAQFGEFKDLGEKLNTVTLGEGSPNYDPPSFLNELMIQVIQEGGHNQYISSRGDSELLKKVAEVYGKKLGRNINSEEEVLITLGANGALFCFIMALVNEGDEVVVLEPCFPPYFDHIQLARGNLKTVGLEFNKENH